MTGAGVLLLAAMAAQAPPVAAPTSSRRSPFYARNTTRVEMWRFFEPPVAVADADYAFVANRLQVGIKHASRRWEFLGAAQYVQFGNLPRRAFGPGPLGSGGAYYDAAGETAPGRLYLKYLAFRFKDLARGLDLQVGRFGYTSGAEASSGDPAIESLKRLRVDSRAIGEFEWSLFQRSFDGVRADLRRASYQLTGAWLRPTQGGFEKDAGVPVRDLNVEVLAFTARPGAWLPRTEAQVFFYRYDDARDVIARPDNTGLSATAVDVGISTFGATLASSFPSGANAADALLWTAVQSGEWYGDTHRAWAVAAEGGYQWPRRAWKPWVRAGVNVSSGDSDPADSTHRTFFAMLPTARRYSLSTVYTQMNLRDLFVQALARPNGKLTVRGDLHALSLQSAQDRWYFGSGVTQKSGTAFGYGGRRSGGATGLATVIEGSIDYAISTHWSVNAYLGHLRGGDVVRTSFARDVMSFAYLESVIQF